MKAFILSIFLTLTLFSTAEAQNTLPVRLWDTRTVPPPGTSYIYHNFICDASGNSYFIGSLDSTNSYTGIFMKYNSSGVQVVNRRYYNTAGGNYFILSDAVTDNSNNIIAILRYDSASSGTKSYIAKFNSSGDILWKKPVVRNGMYVTARKVKVDNSGSIYIGGTMPVLENDFFGGKYNSSGDSVWTAVRHITDISIFQNMCIDANGGIALCGVYKTIISSNYYYGCYVVKFSSGTVAWGVQMAAYLDAYIIQLTDIKADAAGNFITCGTNNPGVPGQYRYSVYKLNGVNGEFIWGKHPDHYLVSSFLTEASSIAIGNANDVYVGGHELYVDRTGNINNTVLTGVVNCYDSAGNVKFTKNIPDNVFLKRIIYDGQGNLYAAGYSYSISNINTKSFIYRINTKGDLFGGEVYTHADSSSTAPFLSLEYIPSYGVYFNTNSGSSVNGVYNTTIRYYPGVYQSAVYTKSVNKSITDNQTTFDTLSVTGMSSSRRIAAVQVKIDSLQHSNPSDLVMLLISPGGVSDTLFKYSGSSQPGIFNMILTDSTSHPIDSAMSPYSGYFRPYDPLYKFNQLQGNQNFVLVIEDHVPGNTGSIRKWSINVLYYDVNTIGVNPVSSEIPRGYSLGQNYPNPFNPVCKIQFAIPKSGDTKLVVYDMLGREVAVLVNEYHNAGTYEALFEGSNLSSGVYFYRLSSGVFVQTKKMILVK